MLLPRIKRRIFNWLYHPLAFTYDLVAGAVSLGHWNEWGRQTLPLIEGTRVLELGHGPGYLQLSLRALNLSVVGLDESRQMGRLASGRLRREGLAELNLARGLAQCLPFPQASFDTLVSIFPSEYIFDGRTLAEARRVLVPGGRFVVMPVAWPSNPLLAWLFRITGESPAPALDVIEPKIKPPFIQAGFTTEIETLDVESGTLMIVIATLE